MAATKPTDLTRDDLESFDPRPQKAGKRFRYKCPVHRSDNQRSLSLDTESNRWSCHACGAWGTLDFKPDPDKRALAGVLCPVYVPPAPKLKEREEQRDLLPMMARWQAAFPGSPAAAYLGSEGIPEALAIAHGVGYAQDWSWRGRGIPRVVFPLTDPEGRLIAVYGRALMDVGKNLRHDYSPGERCYFNGPALKQKRVWIAEGPKDALALIAAGFPADACLALGSTSGLQWEDAGAVQWMGLAHDQDTAGENGADALMIEAASRGVETMRLRWLMGKDPAEALKTGALHPPKKPTPMPELRDVCASASLKANARLPRLKASEVLALEDQALLDRLWDASSRTLALIMGGQSQGWETRALMDELSAASLERWPVYRKFLLGQSK